MITVTVTDTDIQALAAEADYHGDVAMAAICERALAGDGAARAECERMIEDARIEALADAAGLRAGVPS